jgi:hypothetical protein
MGLKKFLQISKTYNLHVHLITVLYCKEVVHYAKRLEKIKHMGYKKFWIMPLRTRTDFKGGGMIRARAWGPM